MNSSTGTPYGDPWWLSLLAEFFLYIRFMKVVVNGMVFSTSDCCRLKGAAGVGAAGCIMAKRRRPKQGDAEKKALKNRMKISIIVARRALQHF